MRVLEFSPEVAADIKKIDRQTIELFGLEQADKLGALFRSNFELLLDNPKIGRHRPEFSSSKRQYCYWTVLSRFIIIYRVIPNGIQIVRILHSSRNIEGVLKKPKSDR